MNVKITIENKTKHSVLKETAIENAILEVLEKKGFDINAEIGLKIVDKAEIKKLNAKFRQKDAPTDVLSFPIFNKPPKKSEEPVLLGDIVICPEMMDNNFLELIQHSTLHLLGFHHKE